MIVCKKVINAMEKKKEHRKREQGGSKVAILYRMITGGLTEET